MIDLRDFAYGGLASIIAETATFAIDTTKTRLQIQGDHLNTGGPKHGLVTARYRGMFNAMFVISKEEGIRALYNGLSAALLRQCVYGTIKMGSYESMKKTLTPNIEDQTLLVNISLAVTAGVLSSVIANPTDVLKIRYQAQNSLFVNSSLFSSFLLMVREEGVRSLWRGVTSTGIRAAFVVGSELPTYDVTKKHILRHKLLPDDKLCHFVSSFTAGFVGALISNPIDVGRTRLMNQRKLLDSSGVKQAAIYKHVFSCMYHTARNESVLALWKGFIPNWLRLGPWNIIYFMSFEQMKRLDHRFRNS